MHQLVSLTQEQFSLRGKKLHFMVRTHRLIANSLIRKKVDESWRHSNKSALFWIPGSLK